MLKEKELILATRKYAVEDRKKSWYHLISTLILFLAAYAGAIVNVHLIPQLICSIFAGLVSARLFIIYHDYLHKSILQQSLFAKILFTIFGLFMLAPTSIWKRSHDHHHAHNSKLYTSSIGSFPLVTKKEFLAASKTEQNIYLFIRHPLTIAFGYLFVFLWGMCLRTLIKSGTKHFDCLVAIVFHVSLGTAIWMFFGPVSFFLGFLLPLMFSHALGAYLFYAQHNFPSAVYRRKEDWSYTDAALLSSSYLKMNRFMQWCTGNIGFHHIHHLNARIPFYNLPTAYAEIPELQKVGVTGLSPGDIYRCLRLKVWDPEQNKMIGLTEVFREEHSEVRAQVFSKKAS